MATLDAKKALVPTNGHMMPPLIILVHSLAHVTHLVATGCPLHHAKTDTNNVAVEKCR